MAFKQFMLDEHIMVTVYKRKTNRNLRLSITGDGNVRVTIPMWAPYLSGLSFARSRQTWIEKQRPVSKLLRTGQAVGKAHHLNFVDGEFATKVTSSVRTNEVKVVVPSNMSTSDPKVQKVAENASIRALRQQAEQLLPQRLRDLAIANGFEYRSVSVKRLKSRWGSCDQKQNIVLNLFLMQLPWDCIDYVLLHELVHTVVLKHGPDFWSKLESVLPSAKRLRKQMRNYQPVLDS
jgi:predicted metal-dependent hydrolase